MIYRYLPKSVGLKRITLHKSMSQGDKMYLLICECSQLQDNLSAAAILLPALRARLCGYTGLYRPSVCFWLSIKKVDKKIRKIKKKNYIDCWIDTLLMTINQRGYNEMIIFLKSLSLNSAILYLYLRCEHFSSTIALLREDWSKKV